MDTISHKYGEKMDILHIWRSSLIRGRNEFSISMARLFFPRASGMKTNPAISTIQAALEQLAIAGFIEKQPFGTLARLLWGAFLEAALRLAHTDEPEATKQEMLLGLE